MSQKDIDEPFAISVDSKSESDSGNDLILYEGVKSYEPWGPLLPEHIPVSVA